MSDGFMRLLRDGDPETGMSKSSLMDPDYFTTGDRTEVIHEFFATSNESVTVGVWECAPCKEEIDSYEDNELMTVLSGSVTITGADGRADTFTAGDTFFIRKGTRLTWEITETLRKFYMTAD